MQHLWNLHIPPSTLARLLACLRAIPATRHSDRKCTHIIIVVVPLALFPGELPR